jgi:hypothetical protein
MCRITAGIEQALAADRKTFAILACSTASADKYNLVAAPMMRVPNGQVSSI